MQRVTLLFPLLMVACSLGEVSLGEDRDAAVSPPPALTGPSAAPSGSSGPSPSASTPAPVPTPNDAGGADAAADLPCPAVSGYAQGPFMTYTATAGAFVGPHEYVVPAVPSVRATAGVLRNTAGNAGLTDIDGFFFANLGYATFSPGAGNLRLGQSAWIILEETTSALVAGTTYPIRFSYLSEASPRDSFPTAGAGPIYRYPGAGPGTCTLTLDGYRDPKATGKHLCMQARFRCTGIVGKDSGETFDIVDGKLSVGE